jgi:hypothetical protein
MQGLENLKKVDLYWTLHNLALEYLEEDHDLVQYLRSIGANDYAQVEL